MLNFIAYQGNANQNLEITLILVGIIIIKRLEITSVGEDVEERELLCTVGGDINWCNHYGKQYGDSSEH